MHDLWAKALAIKDASGRTVLLITLDLVGIDRELSNRIRDAIQSRHGLGRDRIVLASSHTHCGPVVGTNLLTMYRIDDAERQRIADYTKRLEGLVVYVAGRRVGPPGRRPSLLGHRAAATSRSIAGRTARRMSRSSANASP